LPALNLFLTALHTFFLLFAVSSLALFLPLNLSLFATTTAALTFDAAFLTA